MTKPNIEGVPPLPGVLSVLQRTSQKADMIVVSQTPLEALEREWAEQKMVGYVNMICGQEHGTKAEHLKYSAKDKYPADQILMVGDAPGDYKAACSNGVLFFPIIPGQEEKSWAELNTEGLERFFNKSFAGEYQKKIQAKFDASLPEKPHWKC